MAEGDVRNWIREHLGKVLGVPPETIALDKDLASYGLDSVDAVLMAGELEEAMGLEIDPAAFLQHPTLESMIRALGQPAIIPAE
jgi:acyl carrier protein